MRRVHWILIILAAAVLACACPATAGLQGTLEGMQNTVGAALTEMPGFLTDMPAMLTDLPAMLTDLPATIEAGMETPGIAQTGVIRGHLSYPSEYLPAQRIVAFDAATLAFVADVTTAEGQGTYELTVPAGDYYVVAYVLDGGLGAGYSEAVPCGLLYTCTDHSLIPVHVGAGDIVEDIDPQDWYAPPGTFPPMP
jgi:hypothetical protein